MFSVSSWIWFFISYNNKYVYYPSYIAYISHSNKMFVGGQTLFSKSYYGIQHVNLPRYFTKIWAKMKPWGYGILLQNLSNSRPNSCPGEINAYIHWVNSKARLQFQNSVSFIECNTDCFDSIFICLEKCGSHLFNYASMVFYLEHLRVHKIKVLKLLINSSSFSIRNRLSSIVWATGLAQGEASGSRGLDCR